MKARILVIEDDRPLNQMIGRQLEEMGHEVSGTDSLGSAKSYLRKHEPDLIISDMRLPDGDCLSALAELGDSHPVIVLTAYGTVKNAVEAIRAGAADYLAKPVSPEELALTVERVLETEALKADHRFCKARLEARAGAKSFMIGQSPALERVKKLIEAVADSDRCPPWRAKRRRVVPGSREATRDTRRAEGAKGDPKGASERGVQSYGRPVCSRNELAMLWRNAG